MKAMHDTTPIHPQSFIPTCCIFLFKILADATPTTTDLHMIFRVLEWLATIVSLLVGLTKLWDWGAAKFGKRKP